jgi:hypothetical protein
MQSQSGSSRINGRGKVGEKGTEAAQSSANGKRTGWMNIVPHIAFWGPGQEIREMN